MNYLALCNRLISECDISGGDLTTFSGLPAETARVVAWIDTAWMDIQAAHTDWGWLRQTAAFTTIGVSNPIYTLTQCGITGNFGSWQRETFRNYQNPEVQISIASPCVITLQNHGLSVNDTVTPFTNGALPTGLTAGTAYYVKSVIDANTFTVSATAGGVEINTSGTQSGTHRMSSNNVISFAGFKTEVFMEYLDYDIWRNGYLFGALRVSPTRPLVVSISPTKSVCLGPIADSGYTVVGDYFTGPVHLSATTDIPALPEQYHMAIIYKAMMHYGAFIGAPEVMQRGEQEFSKMMMRLNSTRLPEILLNGTMA